MSLFDQIDIYCERLGPGIAAEPLNALTNLAFFVAAGFACLLAKRQNALDWRSGLLIALIAGMGLGSGLFHTLATGWAQLADVLPILIFQISFILLHSRFVIKLSALGSALMLAAFLATMFGVGLLPGHWLNGSLQYAPALLFVTILGLLHWRVATAEKFGLLLAAGTFIISLTFRSVDMQLCTAWHYGTHFLWHCCNALVLYLCTRAYILNARRH